MAIKLNGWYRAAAIILGLAGLGSGGVAVFVTHLEAGPVALLAVGFLLLIIGMGGHMPSRLKVGDNEAAWEVEREAVEVFVERVSGEASVERRPEVIEALGELAEGAPRLAAVGMSGIAYEQLVRHTIMEAFKDDRIEDLDREPIRFITQSKPDMGFDGIVVGPNGRMIAIEVMYTTRSVSKASIEHMRQQIFHYENEPQRFSAVLLVTRSSLTISAQIALHEHPEIRVITFAGPQDKEALIGTVRALIYPS